MTATTQLIAQLQQSIDATLRPLLAGNARVALLGFPNYANAGDSAIWLGTLACLRGLGHAPPCYVADHANYSRRHLARRIGDGTILLLGGGNLGDVWPEHQRFREEVIDDFPANPIVQLPQSIHFQTPAALVRARTVFDRHPRLTLLVREHRSLAIARTEFRTPSLRCPDLAFGLGSSPRLRSPTRAIVWLARTDAEAAPTSQPPPDSGIAPVDWLTERAPLLRLARRLGRHGWLRGPLSRSYDWLARQRLARGARLLSHGRVVITDRLHGHILCLLLGVPHVLLDNSYGKVHSFHETWTRASDLTCWCDDASAALQRAREWARESPGGARLDSSHPTA